MSARSLNKVQLIGNLTRDPELRYTPSGTAVCTFGLATNRSWTTQSGEIKEETEFHRIVAWNKLAELCSQLLTKGRKVYVEGRLSTRSWTAQDNTQRTTTEIVIEDMIILDSKKPGVQKEEMGRGLSAGEDMGALNTAQIQPSESVGETAPAKRGRKPKTETTERAGSVSETPKAMNKSEEINPDDIPF